MAAMKDSGAEWIGEIPDYWVAEPLKYHLAKLLSGGTPDSGDETLYEGTIPFVTIADITASNGFVRNTKDKITRRAQRLKRLNTISPGTVLYTIYATLGSVAILGMDACINQAMLAMVPREYINPKYLAYQLGSLKSYIPALASSNTQQNLNAYKVKQLPIVIPPLKEQALIVNVLDAQCATIDATGRTLEKQISVLEAYRSSVIHEVVTRGLNPAAPTRPSGVDWIGDIAEGVRLVRLKDVLQINNGKEIDNDEGSIPVYGSGGQFKWTNRALCEKPALLLGRKGTIDKPLLVNEPFWTVDTMFYGTQTTVSELRYIYYCTLCFDFGYYQTGSTLPSMTQTDLGGIRLPMPAVEVQREIADYLDERIAAIDAVLETKRRQLDVLKRRRQSLIYEYVTGKRRVSEED